MRKQIFLRTAILLLLTGALCIPSCCFVSAASGEPGEDRPKYRIGYIEGGPFGEFRETLDRAKEALAKEGWLDRVEFPADARFSPGWGGDSAALRKDGEQLMNRQDIDLVLSAGTDATEAMLAVNTGRIPIVGMAVADPIRSGIVKSPQDSGVDNFTVYFGLNVYDRLFRIFHAAVGFQKLGVMYSLSKNGKIFANLHEAHKIARERGFEVIEYGKVSADESEQECMKGLEWLTAQGIDAFYIPSMACFDYSLTPKTSQRLLAYLMEKKIPSFARDGTIGVKLGALMAFSNMDLTVEGRFLANMIISILQGKKPRSLPMVLDKPPSLSLNLYTADQIGFYPSFDILTSCDVIFRKIDVSPCQPAQ